MMEITCKTDGKPILVDDDDYPLLSRFPWYRGGTGAHPMTFLYGKNDSSQTVYMHQLIMGGNVNTDHADLNVLNNQKSNLRPATVQQNCWNQSKRQVTCTGKPPSSQYKGVSKFVSNKGRVTWNVIIKTSKKGVKPETFVRKNGFSSELDAAKYYNEEIVKLRGKFAWVNPLPDVNHGAWAKGSEHD